MKKCVWKAIMCGMMAVTLVAMTLFPAFAAGDKSITIRPNGQATNPSDRFSAYQIFKGEVGTDKNQLDNLDWGDGVNPSALIEAMKGSALTLDNGEIFGTKFSVAWNEWKQTYENELSEAEFVAQWLAQHIDDTKYADDFARIVAANVSATAHTSIVSGGNFVIENLDPGYYLVVDNYESADNPGNEHSDDSVSSYILQVLGQETVDIKSSVPTVDKRYGNPEDASRPKGGVYEVGTKIPFTIVGTVAENIGEFETYAYKFTDTMSKGLTLDQESIKVELYLDTNADNAFTAGERKGTFTHDDNLDGADEYKVTFTAENNTLVIEFKDLKAAIQAVDGEDFEPEDHSQETMTALLEKIHAIRIVVSYTATLNKNAVVGKGGNENDVVLEYANDPYSSGAGNPSTGTTPDPDPDPDPNPEDPTVPSESESYTLALKLEKVDEKSAGMESVKFKLKKGEQYAQMEKVTDSETYAGETFYLLTGWTDEGSATEMETDANGLIDIHGLGLETYTLVETATKKDYEIMKPVTFTVSATLAENGSLTSATLNVDEMMKGRKDITFPNNDLTGHNAQMKLLNFPSPILPHTGGIGAGVVIGASVLVLLLGAVLIGVSMKNKKKGNK